MKFSIPLTVFLSLLVGIILAPETESGSNKEKRCATIGMQYQSESKASGYRLCYGPDENNILRYRQVPKAEK
jgi:hypothetical protein